MLASLLMDFLSSAPVGSATPAGIFYCRHALGGLDEKLGVADG